jgi:hypothetical protein
MGAASVVCVPGCKGHWVSSTRRKSRIFFFARKHSSGYKASRAPLLGPLPLREKLGKGAIAVCSRFSMARLTPISMRRWSQGCCVGSQVLIFSRQMQIVYARPPLAWVV